LTHEQLVSSTGKGYADSPSLDGLTISDEWRETIKAPMMCINRYHSEFLSFYFPDSSPTRLAVLAVVVQTEEEILIEFLPFPTVFESCFVLRFLYNSQYNTLCSITKREAKNRDWKLKRV